MGLGVHFRQPLGQYTALRFQLNHTMAQGSGSQDTTLNGLGVDLLVKVWGFYFVGGIARDRFQGFRTGDATELRFGAGFAFSQHFAVEGRTRYFEGEGRMISEAAFVARF